MNIPIMRSITALPALLACVAAAAQSPGADPREQFAGAFAALCSMKVSVTTAAR